MDTNETIVNYTIKLRYSYTKFEPSLRDLLKISGAGEINSVFFSKEKLMKERDKEMNLNI